MSLPPPFSPDEPEDQHRPTYAVRFSPRAECEAIDAAADHAERTGSPERGSTWYVGLREAAGKLASYPTRFPVRQRESRLLGETMRAFLYRLTPDSRAIYHAFYTVEDNSPDGPRVTILHVRHSARRPLTRREAGQITRDE